MTETIALTEKQGLLFSVAKENAHQTIFVEKAQPQTVESYVAIAKATAEELVSCDAEYAMSDVELWAVKQEIAKHCPEFFHAADIMGPNPLRIKAFKATLTKIRRVINSKWFSYWQSYEQENGDGWSCIGGRSFPYRKAAEKANARYLDLCDEAQRIYDNSTVEEQTEMERIDDLYVVVE